MPHPFDDPGIPAPTADIRDRIRYLIALSRRTQADFAALTETDPAYLSRVLSGKQQPGRSFINRLVVNIGVSKEWLTTGFDVPFPRAASDADGGTVRAAPVYDADVMAGCVPLSRMLTRERVVGYVRLPGITPDTPLVPVSGDSMSPRIRPGSYVAIRSVGLDTISWGQIYVVLLEDYRLIKYVRRHNNPDMVVLHSANPDYDDMEVRRADIKALYLVEKILAYDQLC